MARRLGVIVAAGGGGAFPFATGARASGFDLSVPTHSGSTAYTRLHQRPSAIGRFEGALSFWPAAASNTTRKFAYAFELGGGAFVGKQSYFPLNRAGEPSSSAAKALRTIALGEVTAVLWNNRRTWAGEIGLGVGGAFATRRRDREELGQLRGVGSLHVGFRILNAPHGVLAVRAHTLLQRDGVQWFFTDLQGQPDTARRTVATLVLTVVARFDITQAPWLVQARGARLRSGPGSGNLTP